MRKADEEKIQKILALAKDLAGQRTDEGLDKAAEILFNTINEGYQNPELLVTAANYLLQGSRMSKFETKKEAISLVDKAVALGPENISVLDAAIHCYELILNDFPEKLNEIIQLCLKVLDLDPEHTDCMITLAIHREHPSVALSLEDAIRMLEWAKEIDPSNIYVAFTLARLYSEAGQYGKAIRLYKQAANNSEAGSAEALDALKRVKSRHLKNQHKRYRKYGKN